MKCWNTRPIRCMVHLFRGLPTAEHFMFIKKTYSWRTWCPYFSSRPSFDHLYVHYYSLFSLFPIEQFYQISNLINLIACCVILSSQTRQLNLWGFKRLPGIDAWAHPDFIRGSVDSLNLIRRVEIKSPKHDQPTWREGEVMRRNSITSSVASSSSTDNSDSSSKKDKVPHPSRSTNVDDDTKYAISLRTTSNVETQADGRSRPSNHHTPRTDVASSYITTNYNILSQLHFSLPTENIMSQYYHVEPRHVQPPDIPGLSEHDDNFTFELSQVLDIETRTQRHDDLDSILSWDEA